jgi:hypothetical protein
MFEHLHKTVEPKIVLALFDLYWKNFFKKMKLDDGVLNFLSDIKKKNVKI